MNKAPSAIASLLVSLVELLDPAFASPDVKWLLADEVRC